MPVERSRNFKPNLSAEAQFAKALKRVARHSAHIVELHMGGIDTPSGYASMVRAVESYADAIDPWARRQAAKMLEKVARKNKAAWANKAQSKKQAAEIHQALKTQVAQTELGQRAALLMKEQVDLIKTIPLKAAERAQKLAMEAFYNGSRASEIAEELARTGKVAESDAVRIARTEVARANSVITQARAEAAGSRQYIWRNSGDAAVREAHRKYRGKSLDGRVFSWAEPPTLDDGTTGHPGTFPNCRCYPEPYFPD